MVATMANNSFKSSIYAHELYKTLISASVWEKMVELEKKTTQVQRDERGRNESKKLVRYSGLVFFSVNLI